MGKPHGEGTMYLPDGKIIKARWVRGGFHKTTAKYIDVNYVGEGDLKFS
jgi:hypothetical protein